MGYLRYADETLRLYIEPDRITTQMNSNFSDLGKENASLYSDNLVPAI